MARKPEGVLRRGWTTGACATAATRAATVALFTGDFPDPVTITLPRGGRPAFALAREELGSDYALAGIVKDAGDDPDVTHGALVVATLRRGAPGTGVTFAAGEGVGTVTLPGLPVAVGEPAINPVPRAMMRAAVAEVVAELTAEHGAAGDIAIEISIPGGAALARKTWNPRLGIVGGLSILGTTGVVVPYSCSAWIHSIHSGIDVARATALGHVAGCTGSTSERAVQEMYGLSACSSTCAAIRCRASPSAAASPRSPSWPWGTWTCIRGAARWISIGWPACSASWARKRTYRTRRAAPTPPTRCSNWRARPACRSPTP
jgi:cobalt-precorrin-5B (C1)-methyltransferase